LHAGESLWDLYGLITGLERRFGTDPSVLTALAKARNDLKTIGDCISVCAPSDVEVAPRIPKFERISPNSLPHSSPYQSSRPRVMTAEGTEAHDLCTSILDDMEDMPDEADEFAESVSSKVKSMQESIEKYSSATPKMLLALQNMRAAQLKWLHRDS
jgi:hypothetical protein